MNDIEILKTIKNMLLHAETQLLDYEALALEGLLNLYNKEKEKNNSISIQYEKVVDKLEDLEQIEKEHKEENGRLREEIDLITVYMSGFYDGEKKWKDKIKEKIEKLEKREQELYKLDYELEPEKAIDCILLRKADLQELLEESDK